MIESYQTTSCRSTGEVVGVKLSRLHVKGDRQSFDRHTRICTCHSANDHIGATPLHSMCRRCGRSLARRTLGSQGQAGRYHRHSATGVQATGEST